MMNLIDSLLLGRSQAQEHRFFLLNFLRMRVCSYLLLLGVLMLCSCGGDKDTLLNESEEIMENQPLKTIRPKKIVFFGNSLTAAFGLDPQDGFTAIIERKLLEKDAFFRIINAGISGDTAEEGNARVGWVLQQRIDYFVLELGLNDIFQGASIEEIYQDLSSIIKKVQTAAPDTKILLTELSLPDDFDNSTSLTFTAMYQKLAKELNVVLIDGFLKGVMDVPELNLPDGLHPNAKGQQIIAENVWRILGPMVLS